MLRWLRPCGKKNDETDIRVGTKLQWKDVGAKKSRD